MPLLKHSVRKAKSQSQQRPRRRTSGKPAPGLLKTPRGLRLWGGRGGDSVLTFLCESLVSSGLDAAEQLSALHTARAQKGTCAHLNFVKPSHCGHILPRWAPTPKPQHLAIKLGSVATTERGRDELASRGCGPHPQRNKCAFCARVTPLNVTLC